MGQSTFEPNKRILSADLAVRTDISDSSFQNHLFLRLVAKKKIFKSVDFKYCIFDTCYFRACKFDSCDFTGARFVSTSFHGSTFSGCKFDYSYFEKTIIANDILDTECPPLENLKSKFARTLRINYQQIGEPESVNKAIGVELEATAVHLKKSWSSNESYYRQKYTKLTRIKQFFLWLEFSVLDFIWGNGEKISKLIRFTAIIMLLMAACDTIIYKDFNKLDSYISSLALAPPLFLGVIEPDHYPKLYLAAISFARLVIVGFFLSIIIKRFNRR